MQTRWEYELKLLSTIEAEELVLSFWLKKTKEAKAIQRGRIDWLKLALYLFDNNL